jgi:hypothetical protein
MGCMELLSQQQGSCVHDILAQSSSGQACWKHMAPLLNILPFFCFSFMQTKVKFDQVFGALVNLLRMDMDFMKTASRYMVFGVLFRALLKVFWTEFWPLAKDQTRP